MHWLTTDVFTIVIFCDQFLLFSKLNARSIPSLPSSTNLLMYALARIALVSTSPYLFQGVIKQRKSADDLAKREDMLSLFMTRTDEEGKPFVCIRAIA